MNKLSEMSEAEAKAWVDDFILKRQRALWTSYVLGVGTGMAVGVAVAALLLALDYC